MQNQLTQTELRRLFHYDAETGIFTRLVTVSGGKSNAGTIAGSRTLQGYLAIKINRKLYSAHRLAWLYTHGEFPTCYIDHVNGEGTDNRLCNIRLATNKLNQANAKKKNTNTSGFRGVYWFKSNSKWRATIMIDRKRVSLGLYTNIEDAAAAYKKAAMHHFGEYARIE